MKKVLIPTKLEKIAKEILTAHGGYDVVQDDATEILALAGKHPDVYALIVRSENVTPAVIDACPALKVIIRAGAGFNTIDTKYARKKGIDVMNTPGANANGVAEEVIALMLADARHVAAADASCRRGEWEKKKFTGRELTGKTVGIVGLGAIGRLVAKRLGGFECRFLGYDPVVSSERAREMGVELSDLERLFTESDYVTLHVPENAETKKMVGTKLLSLMKKGAVLVNCARAGILDEAALRALKAEKGIRFLNDVYPKDEAGPKTVADIADLMLPHLGASTSEANTMAARRAAEQLIDFDTKGITSFIVNRDIPEGLDESYCKLANTLSRLCRCLVGRDNKVTLIETSFYGSLQPFGDWLLIPIVAAIKEDLDRSLDNRPAKRYLDEVGIEYVNRSVDSGKGFENSMTVDFTAPVDANTLRRVSVRGTLTEGNMMISRINDFDKLYFEPVGHLALFIYEDRPGVVGAIGAMLAKAAINIEEMRDCRDPKSNRSLAILRLNQPAPAEVVRSIASEIRAVSAASVSL